MELETGTSATNGATHPRITVQLVQKVVARHFGMTRHQLLERTRRRGVARPRQIAMYVAWKLTGASLPDIGQRFGGFDHTTVMYARDRIEAFMRENYDFQQEVEGIMRLVKNQNAA